MDDINNIIIMYLNVPELYALYHTSKNYIKILNTPEILYLYALQYKVYYNLL